MPVLYSFRRCPYAIRARLALLNANIKVELREVLLRKKPESLLSFSPKGTVPVLVHDDFVIDESLDIIKWTLNETERAKTDYSLVEENDSAFKTCLDRYKYSERFPGKSQSEYRSEAIPFFAKLTARLIETEFLSGGSLGVQDIAILPFVRQFANVDRRWFDQNEHPEIQRWLCKWENSLLFHQAMAKYPNWRPLEEPLFFPLDENLVGSETQITAFLRIIRSANITITPGLVRSVESAPPKNLNILLIRIFRDAGVQANPENDLYFDIKNQAIHFLRLADPSPRIDKL